MAIKTDFINVCGRRFRKNTIKSYEPFTQAEFIGIYIYFSTSRERPDRLYFKFETKGNRDTQLFELDKFFGVDI